MKLDKVFLDLRVIALVFCALYISGCSSSGGSSEVQTNLTAETVEQGSNASSNETVSDIDVVEDELVPSENDLTSLANGTPELVQCVCSGSGQAAGVSNGCLEVVNHENIRFCYTESTRILSAYQPDESLWWSFELPGPRDQNRIEHLLLTSEFLILVANLHPEDIERSVYEISSFEFGGAFVGTSSEITFPSAQDFGTIEAFAAHWHAYLVADCFDDVGQGTYVLRIPIPGPHNDSFNLWGEAYIRPSTIRNPVCLSGMVRDSSTSYEQPDNIVLSVNGEELKLDIYTLNPAIAFNSQSYSLERRVEIRDQLLAVLTEPETAFPDIAHRVNHRTRIINPEDNQPFDLDCVDGGTRIWNNWTASSGFRGQGGSFDYSDCRTGSFFVQSGRSISEYVSSNGGFLGHQSRTNFEASYAVSDSVSNEEWLVSTDSSERTQGQSHEPSFESSFEYNIEFVNYTSPLWNLSVAPSRYTISNNTQEHWIGSFSRENYTSAITETVDVDITLSTDEAGNIQMSGFLNAMLVGETTQTFNIEMDPNSNELIKYTLSTNDESMSVTESW